MERKIAIADLRRAVDEAYEKFKSEKGGTVDPRLQADAKDFGIAVVLAKGGEVIKKGDADTPSPLGAVANVNSDAVLLQQIGQEELIKKMGFGKCCQQKPDLPGICPFCLRTLSAIDPANDPDSKWNLLIGNLINMMGSAPELDDKLYIAMKAELVKEGAEDAIAKAQWYLYDNTANALDLYTRMGAMRATALQAATFMATIAADGICPANGQIAYDGHLSCRIVRRIAALGMGCGTPFWMMKTGLPAKASFGGLVAGVLPGGYGIAAYGPALDDKGVSLKAAQAVKYIQDQLDICVYDSARPEFV